MKMSRNTQILKNDSYLAVISQEQPFTGVTVHKEIFLKTFVKLTGKHRSIFLQVVGALQPALLEKEDSSTGFFIWAFWKSFRTVFAQNTSQ